MGLQRKHLLHKGGLNGIVGIWCLFFAVASRNVTATGTDLEFQQSIQQVHEKIPINVDGAIQQLSCYYQQKEDTERVAFPFLAGLLSGGPIMGLIAACAAAKVSKLCNRPVSVDAEFRTDDSYYAYFSSYWRKEPQQLNQLQNRSSYSYFTSYFGTQEPELQMDRPRYSEDDIFGGLLGGLLAGYVMQHSLATAILGAFAASFVATTSGYEGNIVRFFGSSILSIIELCRLLSRRAHALGWTAAVEETYSQIWNATAPYVQGLYNSIMSFSSQSFKY
jgi:hypothetical protein